MKWFKAWMEAIGKADKKDKPMVVLFGWLVALLAHDEEKK